MKRKTETYGKNGILEIKGNPQETILYLRNRPIQYSWYAEVGSTWRFHIAQGLNKQAVHLNKGIEELLKRGIENEGDFLAATEYFNGFMKYGTYEYGYYELFEDVHWIGIPKEEVYGNLDYYGGTVNISPTQNAIDEKIVEAYKEEILKGLRPVIILLHIENSWMFYILDGHHKFHAYRKAKVKPHAIFITKFGHDYATIEETVTLAKEMNCNNKEYIRLMRKEKENLDYYKNQKLNLEENFRRIFG